MCSTARRALSSTRCSCPAPAPDSIPVRPRRRGARQRRARHVRRRLPFRRQHGRVGAALHRPRLPRGTRPRDHRGRCAQRGHDGTICRFDGATGSVVQTYVDPEPGLGGLFGSSIGVDGNVVVVGGGVFGPRESVYVFDGTTGGLEQTIRGPYYGTPYNGGVRHLRGRDGRGAGRVRLEQRPLLRRRFLRLSRRIAARESERGRVARTVTAVFGTSFAIWTDTLKPNAGRGSVTLIDSCGNGMLSPAEQCDDGNVTSGDGCSATCRLERCPTTFPVACHSTLGGSSTVSMRKHSKGFWAVNGDRFVWKWKGASALTDFGDPTANTGYQLCFYDDLFATPDLRLDFAIPAGVSAPASRAGRPRGPAASVTWTPIGRPAESTRSRSARRVVTRRSRSPAQAGGSHSLRWTVLTTPSPSISDGRS